MLAKVWKKALMAICIIACIYNVMNKLVSRTSLETQLNSVVTQTGITDVFSKDSDEESKATSKKEESSSNTEEEVEDSDDNTVVVIY